MEDTRKTFGENMYFAVLLQKRKKSFYRSRKEKGKVKVYILIDSSHAHVYMYRCIYVWW